MKLSTLYDPKIKKHPSHARAAIWMQSGTETCIKYHRSRTNALTDALWMMAHLQAHLDELEVFYQDTSIFHWVK